MNPNFRVLLRGAIGGALFFMISIISVFCQEWGKVTESEWNMGAPSDYPEANVVVIFNNGRMEVGLENIKFTRHVRLKVLNKAGIEEVGDISFAYDAGDKIRNCEAQIILPGGKIQPVDNKGFFTKTAEDLRIKTISFPSVDSGCILEYRYTDVNERFFRLDPWFFQGDIYTIHSQFVLSLNRFFVYLPVLYHIPGQNQKPSVDSNDAEIIKYTWEMENLPPIKTEPYMCFAQNYMAAIYNQLIAVTTPSYREKLSQGWPELGKLYQERYDEYINKMDDLRKLVDSIEMGVAGNDEKGRRIYDYVVKAIELDENYDKNAAKKSKLGDFIEEKKANAYEKNVLMVQMFRAAGFKAWPVLICSREKGVFVPKLNQLSQFDHMICEAEIDSVPVYLDASSKYCPYGDLPPDYRVTGGLRIDGAASRVIEMRLNDPKTLRIDVTSINIDSEGSAHCTTNVKLTGYFADEYGPEFEKEAAKDFIKENFLDKLGLTCNIDTTLLDNADHENLKIYMAYTIDDLVKRLDNNSALNVIQYMFHDNPFRSEKRFFPVDFNYPFVYQNMIHISFEDSIVSVTLPDPLTIQTPGISFSRHCMFDGSGIAIGSVLTLEKVLFPPGAYPDLRKFFSRVASSTEDQIIISGTN